MFTHRIPSRTAACTLALTAALATAGCGSSGASDSAGTTGASTPSGSAPSASAPVSSASTPVSSTSSGSGASSSAAAASPAATQLIARYRAGLTQIAAAHLHLVVTASGHRIVAVGDERLTKGALTALDMTETLQGVGAVRIVVENRTLYVKLPPAALSAATRTKPWIQVTPQSKDQTVKALAGVLGGTTDAASLSSFTSFIEAAGTVTKLGTQQVDGVAATRYRAVVSVADLPASFPNRSALASSGLKTIPVTIYLDSAGRPVRLSEKLTASKQTFSTVIDLTKYNQPVTISAPPASQTSRR